MKPRLRYWGLVWSCFSWDEPRYPYAKAGYGYTAEEAYDEWAQQ